MNRTNEQTKSFVKQILTGPKSGFFIRLYEAVMIPSTYTPSKTRLQYENRTRSCRNWQQYTAYLYAFFSKNPSGLLMLEQMNRRGVNGSRALYDRLLKQLVEMKRQFDSQKASSLYQLIETTKFEPCVEKQENTICPVPLESEAQLQVGPNYMGICADHHAVLHYFTIYKYMEDDKPVYYLSSSYGSDFISVPARTIPLDVHEWSTFLDALADHEKPNSKKVIHAFYEKYFFARKEGVNLKPYFYYNNDTFKEVQEFYPTYVEKEWLTSNPIPKTKAQQMELNITLYQNIRKTDAKPSSLHVYRFDGYQEELTHITRMEGGRKNTRKKRSTRNTRRRSIRTS